MCLRGAPNIFRLKSGVCCQTWEVSGHYFSNTVSALSSLSITRALETRVSACGPQVPQAASHRGSPCGPGRQTPRTRRVVLELIPPPSLRSPSGARSSRPFSALNSPPALLHRLLMGTCRLPTGAREPAPPAPHPGAPCQHLPHASDRSGTRVRSVSPAHQLLPPQAGTPQSFTCPLSADGAVGRRRGRDPQSH